MKIACVGRVGSEIPVVLTFGSDETPYLKPGDVVELEIDGLGRQRQIFEQA